jgi:hypothetical protein
VDGWAVVERVEGRVVESVDTRVVWRGGGGGASLAALADEKTAVV